MTLRKNPRPSTTSAKVQIYEATSPLIRAMQAELRDLAKKSPIATLSHGKVALINRLLSDIKELLKDEGASKYLDMLDDEILPQYADAVLIVSQYVAALDSFHERYFTEPPNSYEKEWAIK